jgi:hypothetical protein
MKKIILTTMILTLSLFANHSSVVMGLDSTSKLEWYYDYTQPQKTWKNSIVYCETLETDDNNNTDWRVPNITELFNISLGELSIEAGSLWSTTSLETNTSKAYIIGVRNIFTEDKLANNKGTPTVVCVRDNDFNEPD